MQSVFCGTRNPLSYDGCKSSERRQSPSEVGSAPNSPPTHTHPSQREVFFKSSNKKKQMLRRFLSFSQLVSHAVPTCFLSFPNPGGGWWGLPPPSGRERGKTEGQMSTGLADGGSCEAIRETDVVGGLCRSGSISPFAGCFWSSIHSLCASCALLSGETFRPCVCICVCALSDCNANKSHVFFKNNLV